MATRNQVSAGGVVYRAGADGAVEVVLIGTQDGKRWGLPKGLVGPGEDHAATALREVREETGLEAEVVRPLPPIEYWYWGHDAEERVRFHKRVYFYLMRCLRGDTAAHDWEVDDARWFPLYQAARLASFPTERKVLVEAQAALDAERG